MQPSENLNKLLEDLESYVLVNGATNEAIQNYLSAAHYAFRQAHNVAFGIQIAQRAKELLRERIRESLGMEMEQLDEMCKENNAEMEEIRLYWQLELEEAPYRFESFVEYMEKNRPYAKKFYAPRKKTLHVVAEDLQRLEDGYFQFYGLSMPSRVGKSTICIFFLCWIACKRPNSHNAMGGHSGILARGFFKELMNFITSEEYTFFEIYKSIHEYGTMLRDKSSEEYTVTLGAPDRFPTLTCRGIDGTWTGAVDISRDGYLYVDDLVRDRQHSLSPTRMEETFQEYLNKMVDRKNDGAKELMVGTLWNVLDPLERMRRQYTGDSRYFFRKIPALDENDESNFRYEINGFSTAYYRDMRRKLDPPEWYAKYQQQPYVREGLLFPSEELRYFNGVVKDEVKCIKAVCDPAFGGGDSLSMPICLETYQGDKFIIDWVFSRQTQKYTIPKICDAIEKHHIVELLLERNNGGRLFEENVKKELMLRGVIFCKVHSKSAPNGMAKEDKIKGYSDFVKDNFIFLEPLSDLAYDEDKDVLCYKRDGEYQAAMNELTMYTAEGKNPHEDAPDSIVQLAMMYEDLFKGSVKAVQNPFSSGRSY